MEEKDMGDARHVIDGDIEFKFPDAFSLVRPLKTGIHQDLYEAGFPMWRVAKFLGSWVNSTEYLMACEAGAARVDLRGRPAGVVTEAEADWARAQLAARGQSLTTVLH
jgi:sRNA-binding protein